MREIGQITMIGQYLGVHNVSFSGAHGMVDILPSIEHLQTHDTIEITGTIYDVKHNIIAIHADTVTILKRFRRKCCECGDVFEGEKWQSPEIHKDWQPFIEYSHGYCDQCFEKRKL